MTESVDLLSEAPEHVHIIVRGQFTRVKKIPGNRGYIRWWEGMTSDDAIRVAGGYNMLSAGVRVIRNGEVIWKRSRANKEPEVILKPEDIVESWSSVGF